jgi:hypothetical protein
MREGFEESQEKCSAGFEVGGLDEFIGRVGLCDRPGTDGDCG